jgi:hypothetical protein
MRRLWWVTLVPCLAWSECPYFSEVTVPASDVTAPGVHGWLMDQDGNLLASSWDMGAASAPFRYELSPEEYIRVGYSAMDAGGVQRSGMTTDLEWNCCYQGSCEYETNSWSLESWRPYPQEGETVSDGQWDEHWIVGNCTGPESYIRWTFHVWAIDFHGNYRTRQTGFAFSD